MITVKFQKLHPDAVMPFQGSEWAAGFDLTAVSGDWDSCNEVFVYRTGIAVEIPERHVGLLFPRSSIFRVPLQLSNSVGVIDADYRGEIKAMFRRASSMGKPYEVGERIVQLVVMPVPQVAYVEAKELSRTKRGTGGYGSTGR